MPRENSRITAGHLFGAAVRLVRVSPDFRAVSLGLPVPAFPVRNQQNQRDGMDRRMRAGPIISLVPRGCFHSLIFCYRLQSVVIARIT